MNEPRCADFELRRQVESPTHAKSTRQQHSLQTKHHLQRQHNARHITCRSMGGCACTGSLERKIRCPCKVSFKVCARCMSDMQV